MQRALIQEAFAEAIKRYPEATSGLVWFYSASGLNFSEPTAEQLEWAVKRLQAMKIED